MPNQDIRQTVVTFRSLQNVIKGNESALEKAAQGKAKRLGDPWQQAAIMAGIGQALREMEEAAAKADPEVMISPQNELACRMQSALAEHATELVPLPEGGKELKFDTITDPLGWAWSWLVEWRDDRAPLKRPASAEAAAFPNSARVAVLGDWGTGLYGAPVIAKSIQDDRNPYTLLFHLGDVYYAGTEKEVQQRFLDLWPKRAEPFTLSRALNSNHEMYSGGFAYFNMTLPQFNQDSSYFALQNDYWTLVGLDTGYVDFDLDSNQVDWLGEVVGKAEGRKVVLLSHHQLFSQLDNQGPKLAAKLSKLLSQKKIQFWYWGHEHRCVLYDRHEGYNLVARCIGHGGMPQRRGEEQRAPIDSQVGDGIWRRLPAKPSVPSAVVLDGRNEYIKGKEDEYGPHGYAILEFNNEHLNETLLLPDGTRIRQQQLA